MRELSLVKTKNVYEAEKLVSYLLNRPKTEMVGLGLIYGRPGLGKSRFARQTAMQNDYIYIRLEAAMTAKSFAIMLLKSIRYHLGMAQYHISGSAFNIFTESKKILRNYDNMVIIIDEIDYAFRSKKILGCIRDIVDETLSVIILVGMATAKEKLLKADAHYFDRCSYFCEFQKLSEVDVREICNQVSEIKISDSIVKVLRKKTKGNIRNLIKVLYAIESYAQAYDLTEFDVKHLDHLKIA